MRSIVGGVGRKLPNKEQKDVTQMYEVIIRDSHPQDIESLVSNMRADDIRELKAQGINRREDFISILQQGLSMGKTCKTALSPFMEVGCMFGVLNQPGAIQGLKTFYPVWLLGTNLIDRYAITFLRKSKLYLRELKRASNNIPLGNWVYVNNTLHRRWLDWLGFKILFEGNYHGEPFLFYLHDE
jgi:hypothetical protein